MEPALLDPPMDPALLAPPAAFGLAGASGHNAGLPLLMISLLARLALLQLAAPCDALQSDVAFYGLLGRAIVECRRFGRVSTVAGMLVLNCGTPCGAREGCD